MSILVGIDFSGHQLDAALVPSDPEDTSVPPVVFRSVELPSFASKRLYPGGTTAQFRSTQRCRAVREAVRELLAEVYEHPEGPSRLFEVTSVWVEEPIGARNKATNVLREIYGGVLASIPSHIERATISPQEWRRSLPPDVVDPHLRPDNWCKADSDHYAARWLLNHAYTDWRTVTEHHREALLVALAGRHLTWQAVERKGSA